MTDTENKQSRKWYEKLLSNYIVRNIILAISIFVLAILLTTIMLKIFTRHNSYKTVPDFVGVTMGDAGQMADKDKLMLEVNDSLYVPTMDPGAILEQRPHAGTKVKSGRRVFVTINSYKQKVIDVPYVAGYSLRQAKTILENSGLTIERLAYKSDIATNNVLEQRVGEELVTRENVVRAEMGTGVMLVVGCSPNAEPVPVPRLAGLTLREAKSRLWDSGLNVGIVRTDDDVNIKNQKDAKVYNSKPDYWVPAKHGREVNLYLTLDTAKLAEAVLHADEIAQDVTRRRFLTDSLRRVGFEGEMLQAEVEWHRQVDKGLIVPEPEVVDYPQLDIDDVFYESEE